LRSPSKLGLSLLYRPGASFLSSSGQTCASILTGPVGPGQDGPRWGPPFGSPGRTLAGPSPVPRTLSRALVTGLLFSGGPDPLSVGRSWVLSRTHLLAGGPASWTTTSFIPSRRVIPGLRSPGMSLDPAQAPLGPGQDGPGKPGPPFGSPAGGDPAHPRRRAPRALLPPRPALRPAGPPTTIVVGVWRTRPTRPSTPAPSQLSRTPQQAEAWTIPLRGC